MAEGNFSSKAFLAYSTDSSMLRNVQNGSEAAWYKFYEKYSALIHYIGQQRQLTKEECQDLNSEVMMIFWKKMDQFIYDRNKGKFRSYLGKIANYCAMLIYAKKQRVKQQQKEVLELEVLDYPNEVNEAFMNEWRDYLLAKAMEDLKEKVDTETYQVFYMSFVQNKSISEITAVTRKTANNIYVIRYRCLALLKEQIAIYRKFGESFLDDNSHKKPFAN